MKPEFTVNLVSDENELTIRQGEALELREPVVTHRSGVLASPLLWLLKRITTIEQLKCLVTVDRNKLSIELDVHETDPYAPMITGKLEYHPMFITFGVNSGKYLTNYQMAQLFKMNRTAFENPSVAMQLVSDLQQFRAKVDKEIEKQNDNKGNVRELRAQLVTSNLPQAFNLVMPIFKGTKKEVFEVEVYINPDDFTCTLVSPVVNDLIEGMRDSEIDQVLKGIEEIAPDIVIIEQ
ncbi:hypothetical protein GO755_26565 [Spirosoma sp. HMF4905]|uniref:Uncharacterized protein n=1 Tax=Spirosoma arboris TaxID=2682092 RepID=A0A7K1SIJ9_9BACT|nr:hypothetical protein [Spirosoma arboris]MVM33630.1 hypothetical protein [Spirosoma arboris]